MKIFLSLLLLPIFCLFGGVSSSFAASASEIRSEAKNALKELYATNPKAKELGAKAYAVLIFPNTLKGGLVVAAMRGDGVLFRQGEATGYYNITALSYGLQVGAKKFNYAIFFMDKDNLKYLSESGGVSLGTAPSLTVVDKGIAGSLSTDSIQKGIYAFIFGQQGLMGGLGLQGSKISEFTPSE